MATPEEINGLLLETTGRPLPPMTELAAQRLARFDLDAFRALGSATLAVQATAFSDAALAARALRLSVLTEPGRLRGELADKNLNAWDVELGMVALAARSADMMTQGLPIGPVILALADCDCWPV